MNFKQKKWFYTVQERKGQSRERSDIDITVSGVNDFDLLVEKIEDLPTLL